jgi:uncharacterized membrane protein (DUF2068 family)
VETAHISKDLYGLRTIAVMEWLKGAGALGAGVLLILHPDPSFGRAAERILRALHIARNSDLAIEVIRWARRIEIRHLHWMLALIFVYATLRMAEGWGLWRARTWAEWFGVLNGLLYLPIELFELSKGFNWVKFSVLLINLLVVWYLGWQLKKTRAARRSHREAKKRGLRPLTEGNVRALEDM